MNEAVYLSASEAACAAAFGSVCSPKETNQPLARTDDVMRAWLNPKHILILTERTSEQTEDPKQSKFWQNERENWRTEIKLKPISISTDGQTKRGGYVFVHLFQLYFCTLLHRTQEVRDLNPITDSLACGWKPTRCNYEHLPMKINNFSLQEQDDTKMGFPVKAWYIFKIKQN